MHDRSNVYKIDENLTFFSQSLFTSVSWCRPRKKGEQTCKANKHTHLKVFPGSTKSYRKLHKSHTDFCPNWPESSVCTLQIVASCFYAIFIHDFGRHLWWVTWPFGRWVRKKIWTGNCELQTKDYELGKEHVFFFKSPFLPLILFHNGNFLLFFISSYNMYEQYISFNN